MSCLAVCSYEMSSCSSLDPAPTNIVRLVALSVTTLCEPAPTGPTQVGLDFKVGASVVKAIAKLAKLPATELAGQRSLPAARPSVHPIADSEGLVNHIHVFLRQLVGNLAVETLLAEFTAIKL